MYVAAAPQPRQGLKTGRIMLDNQGVTPEHLRNLGNQVQGNGLRDYDPEATTKDTVTSQQGSTIEDKLNKIFADNLPTYVIDKKYLKRAKQAVQAIITTETTKARISELEELLPYAVEMDIKTNIPAVMVSTGRIKDRLAALQKEQP